MKHFFSLLFIIALLAGCGMKTAYTTCPLNLPKVHPDDTSKPRLTSSIAAFNKLGIEMITREGKIFLTLPNDDLFRINSAEFKASAQQRLDTLKKFLSYYPNDNILIRGNTDALNVLDKKSQFTLSLKQARVVYDALWEKGIRTTNERQFSYGGNGSEKTVADPLTPHGMRLNRRVEIMIWPTCPRLPEEAMASSLSSQSPQKSKPPTLQKSARIYKK